MANELEVQSSAATTLEQVVINGDLSKLGAAERVTYYKHVCESLKLNSLTQPFQYLTLNGKLTLYATRGATDQLRQIHGVSITGLVREKVDELYVVTASARTADGRTDESVGAVSIKGLMGDNLANAVMKAETKAKRRVTLSIVGLGWLDESELETIRGAEPIAVDTTTGEIRETPRIEAPKPAPTGPATPAMEKRYRDLSDNADVLGIPHESYNPRWSVAELTEKGRALHNRVQEKELAAMGSQAQ